MYTLDNILTLVKYEYSCVLTYLHMDLGSYTVYTCVCVCVCVCLSALGHMHVLTHAGHVRIQK